MIIRKIEHTLAYIILELDKLEREEFFRPKKVQGRKKIAKEDIKEILKQQHDGIQSFVQAMKQDLSALKVMNEKLS